MEKVGLGEAGTKGVFGLMGQPSDSLEALPHPLLSPVSAAFVAYTPGRRSSSSSKAVQTTPSCTRCPSSGGRTYRGIWQQEKSEHTLQPLQQVPVNGGKAEALMVPLADCSIGNEAQQNKQNQQQGLLRRQQDASPGKDFVETEAMSAASTRGTSFPPGGVDGGPSELLCSDGALHSAFFCVDFDENSPYLPLAYLGRGAVGRVYHCVEKTTGEQFAIKVVSKQSLRGRPRLQRQVLAEKEALMALSAKGSHVHPSVGRLRHAYQTPANLLFVLQYAGAVSLRDVLTRLSRTGLRLSLEAARLWGGEAAAALAALRRRGLVHRDIRPENFVVSEEGHLTLIDFDSALRLVCPQQQQHQEETCDQQCERQTAFLKGYDGVRPKLLQPLSIGNHSGGSLARMPEALSGSLHAAGGLPAPVLFPYAGTPAYAAPELFFPLTLGGEEATKQQAGCGYGTDFWSFGCLLHELLLGEPPFKADSPAALALAVCGAQKLSLPQQLPAAAADLITHLLRPREEDRLGAGDIQELLQHPFFAGIDCLSLHSKALPVIVAKYGFAFQRHKNCRCAAATEAAPTACERSANSERDAESAASEADAAAAASPAAAAMEGELSPSTGCHLSSLKIAESECLPPSPSYESNETCLVSNGNTDTVPLSPTISCSRSSSRGGLTEVGSPAPQDCESSNGDAGPKARMQQLLQQHQGSGRASQQSEVTEKRRASFPCAMTEAVLGWGPPLRLRPISTLDYSAAAAASNAEAAAAAAADGPPGDGEDSAGIFAASSSPPLVEGVGLTERGVRSLRKPQEAPRGVSGAPADPAFAARWLLKGERLCYHGVLFRMREHRSFCERLFYRLFGGGHKRRNCQLQPQRCLAVLTDAGRLLLLDPSGKTLRKTVRLATDGEIYTEGKDMLVYSSAEDGCYLLFASEGGTVSSWARSLALSIDALRSRAGGMRLQTEPTTRRTNTSERERLSQALPPRRNSVPLTGLRVQNGDALALRSPLTEWLTSRGGPSGGSPTEGASVPTAATPTARMHGDCSSINLPNHNDPSLRLQEPTRCRLGSLRLTPARPAKNSDVRRLLSEGPKRRPREYTYDVHATP